MAAVWARIAKHLSPTIAKLKTEPPDGGCVGADREALEPQELN